LEVGRFLHSRALQLLHATYLGYHGDAREWLADNRELTKELLNRCGCWLFPKSIELPESLVAGAIAPLTLSMENRGVAPPYAPYGLRVKLSGMGTKVVRVLAKGGTHCLPGAPNLSRYELTLPADLKAGSYAVAIGLFAVNQGKERPVEFALKASARDAEGYHRVASAEVTAPPPPKR